MSASLLDSAAALAVISRNLDILRDIEAGVVYAPGEVLARLSAFFLRFREGVAAGLDQPARNPDVAGEHGRWWLNEDGSAYGIATAGVSELLLMDGMVAHSDVRRVLNGAPGVSYRIPAVNMQGDPLLKAKDTEA